MPDVQLPQWEGRFNALVEGSIGVITPDDDNDLSQVVSGLNVSETGPVKVTLFDGTPVALQLVAGVNHRMLISRVWATGTSAGTIVGLL